MLGGRDESPGRRFLTRAWGSCGLRIFGAVPQQKLGRSPQGHSGHLYIPVDLDGHLVLIVVIRLMHIACRCITRTSGVF